MVNTAKQSASASHITKTKPVDTALNVASSDQTQANNASTSPDVISENSDTLNTTQSTSQSDSNSSTTVTVNGQNIPVPESGDLQKTITNPGGTTDLNVSSNSSGTASNSSSTNVQINLQSSSNSSDGGSN